jgi:hypothetical protein
VTPLQEPASRTAAAIEIEIGIGIEIEIGIGIGIEIGIGIGIGLETTKPPTTSDFLPIRSPSAAWRGVSRRPTT